jgi:hypothetical protein
MSSKKKTPKISQEDKIKEKKQISDIRRKNESNRSRVKNVSVPVLSKPRSSESNLEFNLTLNPDIHLSQVYQPPSIVMINDDEIDKYMNDIYINLNEYLSTDFDDICYIYANIIDSLNENKNDSYVGKYRNCLLTDDFQKFNEEVIYNRTYVSNDDVETYYSFKHLVKHIPEDKTPQTLKSEYNDNLNDFLKYKCYLDGADIMHDVLYKNVYYNKLQEIIISFDFNNEFNNACNVSSSSVKCNNYKLKYFKNYKILELKKNTDQYANVILPNFNASTIGNIVTQELGFVYYCKEIVNIIQNTGADINSLKFTYRESGRGLYFKKLVKYYQSLNILKKDEFKKLCGSNCKQFIEDNLELKLSSEINFEINTEPISSFDACKQTIRDKTIINDTVFYHVYGFYNYHVRSYYYQTKPIQIVVVIDKNNLIKAIFLFSGDLSINFLLEMNNIIFSDHKIEYSRTKGKVQKSSFIIFSLTDLYDNVIDKLTGFIQQIISENDEISYSHTNYNDNLREGYIFHSTNVAEKQLLLLGNKTIGDLIFSSDIYKDKIYSISTLDTFVWSSVLYNYLRGNSNILQSVWEKNGNGWKYYEGIFNISKESISKYVIVQASTILAFINYYIQLFYPNDDLLDKLKNIKINILKYIFNFDKSTILNMNNMSPNIDIIRIKNCMTYILNFNNFKSHFKYDINTNTYNRLFWNLLTTEFKHKYEFLLRDYLKNILEIYYLPHSDINLEYLEYLINKLRSIPKFSSKFYINTTAIYKNNLQNIFTDINKINNIFRENKANRNLRYFKIDPNLEKVIKKEKIIFTLEQPSSETIEIINLIVEPNKEGYESVELILNKHQYLYSNIIVSNVKLNKKDKKAPQNFFRIPSENIRNIIGYKIYDTIYEDITPDNFNFLRNNYIIEDSHSNRRIKYQLINKTLNYSELEIVIFCDELMETKGTNLTYLGEVHGPGIRKPDYKTYIHLLKVDNTIGNLFELLNIPDILNDKLTTKLIITKILIQFRSMYVMYYDFYIVDDVIIDEIFSNNLIFLENIMMYNLDINIDLSIDVNKITLKNLIKETYLNVTESTINVNEDNNEEEDEEEEEEEEEQKSMSNGKNINNKQTKKKRK